MKRLFLLLAIIAVAATSCRPTAPFAAIVNSHVIDASTIEDDIRAVTSSPRYAEQLNDQLGGLPNNGSLQPGGSNTVSSEFTTRALYIRILDALMTDEMAREHITVSPQQRDAAERRLSDTSGSPGVFESLAANYRNFTIEAQSHLSALLAARSSPQAESAYYASHQNDFVETCFRRITAEDEDTAKQYRDRVLAGGDFAALAAEAAGPQQANPSNGAPAPGAPVCLGNSRLSDFAKAALAPLKVNEVSNPIQDSTGYTIVQVTSRNQQTFDQAEPAIKSQLSDSGTLFNDLLKQAKIKVNPRYGDYQPPDESSGQAGGVAPHPPVALKEGSDLQGASGLLQDGSMQSLQ